MDFQDLDEMIDYRNITPIDIIEEVDEDDEELL